MTASHLKTIHSERETTAVRAALLAWYAQNKRDLPWRQDRNAYRVWVSEIMLQQTRVAAVLEHYRIFLNAFPTVEALAKAEEDDVLALWSGLGYYRRARMLHQAARFVVDEMNGVIPATIDVLRALPGVGRYTAAAISSIAFGAPVAVVDGNVERVLSRMDGEPQADASAWKRAQELLDPRSPGDWNQAMMELGAIVCTPQNPQCLICPVHTWCRAPGAETGRQRPARKRVKMKRAFIERNNCVYLVQRPFNAAKMAGMWELPELIAQPDQNPGQQPKELCVVRHSITDTDYEVSIASATLKALDRASKKTGQWVARDDLHKLPLTGLTRKVISKLVHP